MNVIRKRIPNGGGIESKTITKLLVRIMNRGIELLNDKEITTTPTAPGTIRIAVGRDIWSKMFQKTSVKKPIKSVAVFKTE